MGKPGLMGIQERVDDRLLANRYRLHESVGRGGMGVVWRATDELLQRPVAVKQVVFPPGIAEHDAELLRARTLREARSAARLDSPATVRVFDVVEVDGGPWIVMELVEGPSLSEVLRDRGPMTPAETARLGLGLVDGLAQAHAAGIVHRDVKPGNVLFRDDDHVVLSDFGIARFLDDPTMTTTGLVLGSPAYIAPERVQGQAPQPAADLWSLGATLYTAVEGQPPYERGEPIATLAAVVHEPPAPMRRAGPLAPLLTQLLSHDPAARPDIAELRRELQRVASSTDARPPPATRTLPTEPVERADRTVALSPPRRHPAPPRTSRTPMVALAALLLIVGMVGAGYAVLHRSADAIAPGRRASAGATSPAPSSPTGPARSGSRTSASPPTPATSALPAGRTRFTDPTLGWTVSVPAGWQRRTAGGHNDFVDPQGGRYVRIDTTTSPGPSAKGAWEDQERSFTASHKDFQRIRLENVQWRDYPDVADWEFTYRDGGTTLHALDRGVVVGGNGYGIFFQTHDDEWDASQSILHDILASFRPAS